MTFRRAAYDRSLPILTFASNEKDEEVTNYQHYNDDVRFQLALVVSWTNSYQPPR